MKTFFNNLSMEQAQKEFNTYFIPECRIKAKGTEIDFGNFGKKI